MLSAYLNYALVRDKHQFTWRVLMLESQFFDELAFFLIKSYHLDLNQLTIEGSKHNVI